MKGDTVSSYSGIADKLRLSRADLRMRPSQVSATPPTALPHLRHPSRYFQSLEPVTVLSPLCLWTNCHPLLNHLPRPGTFLRIIPTCFKHHPPPPPCHHHLKLLLKSPGWSNHIFLPANNMPWTYSYAGTWAPALQTWAASACLLWAPSSVRVLFIFISPASVMRSQVCTQQAFLMSFLSHVLYLIKTSLP